jgi:hypothetical protein
VAVTVVAVTIGFLVVAIVCIALGNVRGGRVVETRSAS